MFRLASHRELHPSRRCGCCSGRAAITRRQPFVATRPPGDRERPSLSFGLQAWRGFQASSGPLGGTEALLESTFEAQGDIPWKSHRLGIRINQKKHREYLSHPSFGEINIWNFSLLPVDISSIWSRIAASYLTID